MNVNLDNLKNRGSVNKLQLNLSLQCFKCKTQFLVIGAAGQWSCWNTVRFLVKSPFSPFLIDLQIFVPRMNSQFLFWWRILCMDIYCGFGYIYVCPRASALIKREIQLLKAAGPVFSGSTHPYSGSFWVCLPPENLQTKPKFQSKDKCLYMRQEKRKKKNHSCSDQITLPAHLKTVLI